MGSIPKLSVLLILIFKLKIFEEVVDSNSKENFYTCQFFLSKMREIFVLTLLGFLSNFRGRLRNIAQNVGRCSDNL